MVEDAVMTPEEFAAKISEAEFLYQHEERFVLGSLTWMAEQLHRLGYTEGVYVFYRRLRHLRREDSSDG